MIIAIQFRLQLRVQHNCERKILSFLSRFPPSSTGRLGVTCTDGELWAEQRNFVSRHLRRAGYGRQAMEEQIQFELNELLEVIDDHEGKAIWPSEILPSSVLNVLWTFTAGKKISRGDERLKRLLELMKRRSKAFDMSGGWLNIMPFLRFIAPEKTSYNLIKRFNIELLEFFKPIVAEHKNDFTTEKIDDDLIYAFINEMRNANGAKTNFTDIQLTMVILDLFVAGANSTSNTLDFSLMSLVLYPEIQKKCQQHIDAAIGNAQLPTLKDKSRLAYIEAVILEAQRMYNIVPISGPRRVLKPTVLGGYHIPVNTTVLMGLETVNMDTEYWVDPDVFRPERFLDANNTICNTERLVAFGQGRRRCLGEALARAAMFTYLVGILQKYNLELPPDAEKPSTVPLPGILNSVQPYQILFKRR